MTALQNLTRVHDEPQHIYQGEVTVKRMEDMDVSTCVVDKKTSEEELLTVMSEFRKILSAGKSVAFVICKGALTDAPQVEYKNDYSISREDTIRHIVSVSGEDSIVSTTGK